jgi:chorismate--pyruvate lyase
MNRAHFSTIAHWSTHINRCAASAEMRDWLMNRQSLTSRLVARCKQFQVQRLHQHAAQCLPDEFEAIGLPKRLHVVERDVLLRCDGEAVVYAHTVLPLSANAGQWPLFSSLGNKSLGTTLFSDPLVVRGTLHFALLRARHPLMRRIVALNLWEAGQVPHLHARRSVFVRQNSPLLVTEIFLPSIQALPSLPGG